FLPSIAVLGTAIALSALVRSRGARGPVTGGPLLGGGTGGRGRGGPAGRGRRRRAEQRETGGPRRLAEERLRIARELHDTVAHSMATITVQAASALHVLSARQDDPVREVLATIRDTSKSALGEMRAVLGQLRDDTGGGDVTVRP